MANPNLQTNGASLEDCHTNFFALTDLCGIRWRRFTSEGYTPPVASSRNQPSDYLKDPVLSSYWKCLSQEILCVWRRIPTVSSPSSNSAGFQPFSGQNPFQTNGPNNGMPSTSMGSVGLSGPKELWIFWYGDEPDLSNLVVPELMALEGEQGSWENGLSYESRSLLFKALHNLIERSLLSRELVRLGKWFVHPQEPLDLVYSPAGSYFEDNKENQLSFSFSFFVHGESTVCSSIDVRRHPAVRRLSQRDLNIASSSGTNVPVILAPYGLAATLTGVSYRSTDHVTRRLLEEWRQFYPISLQQNLENDMPAMVEVVTGGIKMRYPSCFVLTCDADQQGIEKLSASKGEGNGSLVFGALPEAAAKHCSSPSASEEPEPVDALAEPAWQDSIASCALVTRHEADKETAEPTSLWSLGEPCTKMNCTCSKSRRSKSNSQNPAGWQDAKGSSVGRSKSGRILPFHTRQATCALTQASTASKEASDTAQGTEVQEKGNSSSGHGGTNAKNSNAPLPSYFRNQANLRPTPTAQKSVDASGTSNSNALGAYLQSPASVAPSPLRTPYSQQPASVLSVEAVMPVLSPQLPHSNDTMGFLPTTPATGESHQVQDAVGSCKATPIGSIGPRSNQGYSPYVSLPNADTPEGPRSVQRPPQVAEAAVASEPANEQPAQTPADKQTGLLRPVLPRRDYENELEEEGSASRILYDFDSVNAWMHHPVKKVKLMNEPGVQLVSEPADTRESESRKRKEPEKDDDESGVAHGGSGSKPADSSSLFTIQGLEASYRDLENIFDDSDETNNDTFSVPTPPGSNKPAGMSEDTGPFTKMTHTRTAQGTLHPAVGMNLGGLIESLKMFPTPPSLEQATHSPSNHVEFIADATDGHVIVKSEMAMITNGNRFCDPSDDKEYSLVYSSPAISKPLIPAKYAPLPMLPSQMLPPLNITAKYVHRQPVNSSPRSAAAPKTSLMQSINLKPLGRQLSLPQSPHLARLGPPAHFNPMPHSPYVEGMSPFPPSFPHPRLQQPPQASPSSLAKNPPPLPEGHALAVNIILSESLFNVFRDHNFDSCTVCVCNAGPNCVGTIKGPDAFHYLPPSAKGPLNPASRGLLSDMMDLNNLSGLNSSSPEEENRRCNCGFSALVNRRFAHRTGLFYEDEAEITGAGATLDPGELKRKSILAFCHSEKENLQLVALNRMLDFPYEEQKNRSSSSGISDLGFADGVPPPLMELVREQSLLIFDGSSPFYRAAGRQRSSAFRFPALHSLDLSDCSEVARSALNAAVHSSASIMGHQLQQPPPPYMGFNHMLQHQSPVGLMNLPHPSRGRPHPPLPPLHIPGLQKSGGTPVVSSSGPVVHYWPFLHAQGPQSSQDVMRIMRILQPVLQDALQSKRGASFAVQGPLTWRKFHLMAVRGTEDRCEPLPIPTVLAGYDRDWVAIAPLAIPHWERLLLEPYAQQKNVAYVIVAPDEDSVLAKIKSYFRDLSLAYEACRFGRHAPAAKFKLRDGILRVGKSAAASLANDPVDDWFLRIGDSPIASLLRLYAKVCCRHLGPLLATTALDRTLYDPPPQPRQPHTMAPPSSMPFNMGEGIQGMIPPGMPGYPHPLLVPVANVGVASAGEVTTAKPETPGSEANESSRTEQTVHSAETSVDEDESTIPSLVIYMIDPFTMYTDNHDLNRLAILGLLRAYHQMLASLPENMRPNISIQLVSLESIMKLGTNGKATSDSLRSLALNVYSQSKKVPPQGTNIKSLTGMGPGASTDLFINSKDEQNRLPWRFYTPPFVLAPLKDSTQGLEPNQATGSNLSMTAIAKPCVVSVLYVSYCLSEDQRWLLASCTDERGELIDTCTIGIDIPNRTKRKRVSARRYGLQKLMDFIMGVVSTDVHPWRLVIGRLGRMGHGELKSWSVLLSRKSLLRTSAHISEVCRQCSLLGPSDGPIILSACLISLEPDSQFRMMTDQITHDGRFGQQSANCALSTPEDATCTHILVFPTSATTTSSQTAFQEQHINGPDLGDDDFLIDGLNEDMGDGFEDMGDFNDFFSSLSEADPVSDVTNDMTADLGAGMEGIMGVNSMSNNSAMGPPSPSRLGGGRQAFPGSPSGHYGKGNQDPGQELQEEVGTLLQQPLALGYYVSTAPTGDMPAWFWASCPHLAKACPSFLKCSLHLHNHAVQQASDDFLQQQPTNTKVHPLDSQVTTDVLRYVMEGYNALSWLSMDPSTKDRRSCLPVHIQLLAQLYNTMAALI